MVDIAEDDYTVTWVVDYKFDSNTEDRGHTTVEANFKAPGAKERAIIYARERSDLPSVSKLIVLNNRTREHILYNATLAEQLNDLMYTPVNDRLKRIQEAVSRAAPQVHELLNDAFGTLSAAMDNVNGILSLIEEALNDER